MGSILAMVLLRPPKIEVIHPFQLPLPPEVHHVITAEDIGNRCVLIIGDVHGCLDELKELLNLHSVTPENTLIIFCGDIINKGPKNLETLQFVRDLGACVTRGNHEEHVLKEHRQWLRNRETGVVDNILRDKYTWIQSLTEDDINYLNQLPYTISLPSLNSIVVHAGIVPWKPLQQQQPADMTLMRNVANGDCDAYVTKVIEDGIPWAAYWNGPQHIYYGHDATRGLQLRRFATGLDTGCLYGNSLTAAFIHPYWKIVSVPAKKQYRKP